MNTFLYTAYTLTICSSVPLPEMLPAPANAEPDIYLRVDHVDLRQPEGYPHPLQVRPEGVLACWEGVGTFLIRDGREVIVDPVAGVEDRVLRLFLLGACMGILLQQRGYLVLHGSAVIVDGGAVAFLGQQGYGKSTMAAAMYARGYPMLADDVVAVDFQHPQPIALPGFPQFKLWPEAADSLGEKPENLARLHPLYEKRALPARRNFWAEPVPVKCLCLLGRGPEVALVPIFAREALIDLMSRSYAPRSLAGPAASGRHFQQCTTLVERVPIYRLERPADLKMVPAIAEYVEKQLVTGPLERF